MFIYILSGHIKLIYTNLFVLDTPAQGIIKRLDNSSTGITPPAGSLSAALIACDAFNARTVTGQEYH